MCRQVAHEEGVLVGGSGGLALAGALRFAGKLKKEAVIVVLLPDSGRSYLSKIYNDEWMRDQGYFGLFLGNRRIGELLKQSGLDRTMIHADADEPVFQAIDRLHAYGISQMPVLSASTKEKLSPEEDDAVDRILGVVEERGLLERIFRDPDTLHEPVKNVMEPPLPIVEAGSDISTLVQVFRGATSGTVVVEDQRILGIITRSDLLDFVSHQNSLKKEY
jgi:cystathionine beta-synthase